MPTSPFKSFELIHHPGTARSSYVLVTGNDDATAMLVDAPSTASSADKCVTHLTASSADTAVEIVSDDGAVYASCTPPSVSSASVPWWVIRTRTVRLGADGTGFIVQRVVSQSGGKDYETTRVLFIDGTSTSKVRWSVFVGGAWSAQTDMATIGKFVEVVAELPSGSVTISGESAISGNTAMTALKDRFVNVLIPATQ